MATPAELQAVSLTVRDLAWIVGTGVSIVGTVAVATLWLQQGFAKVQKSVDALKETVSVQSAAHEGTAKLTDSRLTQHSDRMTSIEARVRELERWRLDHVEDHQ